MTTEELSAKILAEVSDEAKKLALDVTDATFTKNRATRRFTAPELRSLLVATLWKFEQMQKDKS
jgi:hypothetical protein